MQPLALGGLRGRVVRRTAARPRRPRATMTSASASAMRRGAGAVMRQAGRPSARAAGPRRPASAGRGDEGLAVAPASRCCSLSCGDAQRRVADFLDDHGELLEGGRKPLRRCRRRRWPPAARTPTCTSVLPGGNGPCTVTCGPLTVACGDEPCMMPQPLAPAGMSNSNGVGGFTGAARVVDDVEEVVHDRRPRRRGSMTMRDCAADDDLTGDGRRRGAAAARSFALSVATSSRRMPPCAGAGNSCDSSRSPSTIGDRLHRGARRAASSNCARPLSSVFTVGTFDPTCSSTG